MIIADGALRDHESLLRRGKREGETIVKFKMLLVSLAYLIAVYLLASPSCIGIFTHGMLTTVIGVITMLAATGTYGMYMYSAAIGGKTLPEIPMNKESEYTKYRQLADWFRIFRDLDRNNNFAVLSNDLASAYREGLVRDNPFRYTELGDRLQVTASDISIKYDQTLKILSESFEKNDITYQNYLSVLDNVLKLSSSHLKAIKKRVCVFDYRTWSENKNDEMCRKYIEEVRSSVSRLEEIGDKFDKLLHELICLSEISEDPLNEMQDLIETTSDYKSIEDQ